MLKLGTLAYVKVKVKIAQSCQTPCDPMDWACQAPLSTEFSRQEYWNGLPFPSPGDLPDPEIEPASLALQADSLPAELPGKLMRASSIFPSPYLQCCLSRLLLHTEILQNSSRKE